MKKNNLEELLRNFENYLAQEERSRATMDKYLRDIRMFLTWSEGRPISKELTLEYKRYLEEKNYAPRSINSMLAALNCFLAFQGRSDCRIKALRLQRSVYCREEKELTKSEYMRLLSAARKDERLQLIMQTICATGIRVSELCHFTVEALQKGEITVRCKGKSRTILIPGKLKKTLLAWARRQSIRHGAIFITRRGTPLDRSYIWARMKSLCKAAGVAPSKVFPHNLRKLFARTFYTLEKDIAKLADILGHSNIETTRLYIMTSGREHRRKLERLGLML